MIDGLEAITFDFGNTLVAFPARQMAAVLQATATLSARSVGVPQDEFLRLWTEERQRQMVEDVPEGREAYMDVRAVRVLARLRGCPVPGPGGRWNDAVAATYSSSEELAAVLDAYATAFVDLTPAPPEIRPLLERLAGSFRLAIVSNWPLTMAIDRFVEAAGWAPHLSAVVVSHQVGVIKPEREIFEVAAARLGVASGPAILHVGDDPGADVVGAQALGWRAALVRIKPEDSSLPVAPAVAVVPDIQIDTVLDLEAALGLQPDAPTT
jgi:FMN phosphatase YigB (HAD superfamily)